MDKKILGMGNAVLDILAPVTEDFIKSKNLDKGSMTLVDQQISDKMLDQIEPVKKDSGGSVANTIVAISLLGLKSFFCGKVKSDNLGDDFISDMKKVFPTLSHDWGIYIPEVKYLSPEPLVNYNNLSLTKYENVHFVGDALSARGITVSGAQGIYVAEDLIKWGIR